MRTDPRFSEHTILFVDDEEPARKYFPRIMGDGFQVRVAGSVAEAEAIAAEEGSRLAVVISDQRMPGGTGVDLFTRLRQERPQVVRILTTAYTDYDSAVKAVNDGAIWQYVHKPWDSESLRITVTRALELYLETRERDILLREKLSALRRLIVIDRVRSYAVLATGLANRLRNPLLALRAFLDLAPNPEEASALPGNATWSDLLNMAQQESHGVLDVIQRVVTRTIEPDFSFAPQDIAALVRQGLATVTGHLDLSQVPVTVSGELPPVQVDGAKIVSLFRILGDRALALSPHATRCTVQIMAQEIWGAPGVRVRLIVDGPAWGLADLQASFLPRSSGHERGFDLQADLLSAFFVAYHHSGDLLIRRDAPEGPGFTVDLPLQPANARLPDLDPQWLERVFTHYGE